jgi:hypothetical protein
MSDTIATDLVAAANDIGQLLRRDGDVAEQERRITKPPRDALAEAGFFRLLTAPLLKDSIERRSVPWNASLDDHQCEAGTKPARRIIERSPSTKGDAP